MKGKRKEDMLNRINESSSIVLWGLSFLGERVNTYLKENDITVDFYWDINAENMFDREEKIYLPGDVAPKNALIIICIGNNVLRERLIEDIKGKGYENILEEELLKTIFDNSLRGNYAFAKEFCGRELTERERLVAAIDFAISNDYVIWDRQFEYVEKMRIAKEIYIAGTYEQAIFVKTYMYNCNGIRNIIGYFDGNDTGKEKEDIKHFIKEEISQDALIIITSSRYNKMVQELDNWFCDINDLILNVFTKKHSREYWVNSKNKILQVYDLLADDRTREVFTDVICNRVAPQYAINSFEQLKEPGEYFSHGLFEVTENECFVDAGAYNGDTILEFLEHTDGKYEQIYAFELDRDNYQIMCKQIEPLQDDRIRTFCAGVYSKNGEFGCAGSTNGVYISDNVAWTNNVSKVVALDEELGNKRITFIKMDIEGSELEALKGTKRIIETQKPKIAMSVYHKLEDIWELPLFIKEIDDNYKIYMRHHSYYVWDTDMYCVVDTM